jgi:hypothetical protein
MSTVIIKRTTTITKTIRHYPAPKPTEWEQLEFDFVVS